MTGGGLAMIELHKRLISAFSWYPDAEWAELEVATAYSVWIFVWDDEVDGHDTETSNNADLTRRYAQRSRAYIRQSLGLDHAGEHPWQPMAAPPLNMVLFEEVGRSLVAGTDVEQRTRFLQHMEHFMCQVGVEHTWRLRGEVPSVEKYLEMRAGSVGCFPQIAITEYVDPVISL